jgi:protein-disulfide isomerase
MDNSLSPTTAPVQSASLPANQLLVPNNWVRIFGYGLLLGLFAGAVFGMGLGLLVAPKAETAATQPTIVQAPQGEVAIPTVLPDMDVAQTMADIPTYRTMGKPDAPVKIVLFEDPLCPYCQKMSTGPVVEIIEQYVKTGKASLSYRHSLFLGPDSFTLAAAMDCAGVQNKFWEFHDQVYASGRAEGGVVHTEALTDWAKLAGVQDSGQFVACLDAGKQGTYPGTSIQTDQVASKGLRVTGTPTLFVNGKRLVGYAPMEFIRTSIEEQLRGLK